MAETGYKKSRPNFTASIVRRAGNLAAFFVLPTLVLIIASLYWAQAILIPVALSILLAFLLSPVAGGLERIGLGRLPSVILIVVLTFSLLALIGWVVTLQLASMANDLPTYRENIKKKISDIRGAGKGGALEKVKETAEEVKEELQKKEESVSAKPKPRDVVV